MQTQAVFRLQQSNLSPDDRLRFTAVAIPYTRILSYHKTISLAIYCVLCYNICSFRAGCKKYFKKVLTNVIVCGNMLMLTEENRWSDGAEVPSGTIMGRWQRFACRGRCNMMRIVIFLYLYSPYIVLFLWSKRAFFIFGR